LIWLVLVACTGWALVAFLFVLAWRRRALVADAEHELRGAAAAIGLAADRMARDGATAAFSWFVRLQLDRMAGALADLGSGRSGGAPLDAERLAQVLGNLIANAAEHGVGPVDVRASRGDGRVSVEIRNRERPRQLAEAAEQRAAGRGRGLAIAERAARELGGDLRVASRDGETRAELDLPAAQTEAPDRAELAPPGGRRAA
jgi:anti-sigma regulatory factor (Ser/Thr protein kinase)